MCSKLQHFLENDSTCWTWFVKYICHLYTYRLSHFFLQASDTSPLHIFYKYPSYAFCLCECVCSLWQLLTICALCDVLQLPFFPFLSDLFMLLLLFSMQTTQKTQQFKLHRIVNEHLLLLLKFFFFFFPFATFVVFICRIENFPTRWMQFVTTHTLMIVV